jgi:translocation and assembly module TamB
MNYLRKGLKVLAWILGSIVMLLLLVVVALQFRVTQRFITSKAVAFLSEKTGTRVELEGINVAFPKSFKLTGIYIEDQQKDTLFYSREIKVDIDFLKMFGKKIEVNQVKLEGLTAHIRRSMPDSSFNFDFITEAFASGEPKKEEEQDTAASGWKVSLMGLKLERIYFTYSDQVSGNDAVLRLGELVVKMDEFDLDNSRFVVDKVRLSNTIAALVQRKPPQEEEKPEEESATPDIGLGSIVLSNVHIRYDNRYNGQQASLDLGKSELEAEDINMEGRRIALKKFLLTGTRVEYVQNRTAPVNPAKKAGEEALDEQRSPDWIITLANLDLHNNHIRYDNHNEKPLPSGIDFNHLLLQGFTLQSNNISLKGSNAKLDLKKLAFKDRSGFELKSFSSHITFDSTHAELAELDIRTGASRISDYIAVRYSSLESLADSIGNLKLNIRLNNTSIALADLLHFQPGLASGPPFSGGSAPVVRVSATVDGYVKDLRITRFQVSTGESTYVSAKGAITGLPDMDRTHFDMLLEQFLISERDIRRLVPRKMIAGYTLPSRITAKGYFKGMTHTFNSELSVLTTLGSLQASIQMQPGKSGSYFEASANVNELQLGQLLNDTAQFGPVTVKVLAKGTDLTSDKIVANVNATVVKAVMNRYPYQNLTVAGILKKDQFIGGAEMKDENLVFKFNGDVKASKDTSSFKFTLDLAGADLKALHFTQDDIRVSGRMETDLRGNTINTINGSAGARDVIVIKNGKKYPVDSLVFGSVNTTGNTDIKIDSPVLTASFKGSIVLSDLAKVLKEHLNGYFNLQDTTISKELEPQRFTFNVDLKDPSIFTDVLVPKLEKLEPGTIQGEYDSESKRLSMALDLPEVQYAGTRLTGMNGSVSSDREKINYNVNISEIARDSIALRNISVAGNIRDSVSIAMRITDDDKKDKFLLSGSLESKGDEFVFRFSPRGAVLNYQSWSIPADNYMIFGSFYANNVKFMHGDQMLYVESNGKSDDPLVVQAQKFDISSFTGMLESKKPVAGGIMDGSLKFTRREQGTTFVSDITLQDFSFMGDTLGNIALQADNTTPGRYTLDARISGRGNDIRSNGYYEVRGESNALDLRVDLEKVDLSRFRTYSMGALKQLSGGLNGQLHITGSTEVPRINGGITMTDALINAAYTNSPLRVARGEISFDEQGISIRSIPLRDSLDNTGELKGKVYTDNYRDYRFDLSMNTRNLLVMNSTPGEDKMFYGSMFLDSDIKVKGDMDLPVIDAKLKLNKGTDFVFVKPEDEVTDEASQGVVMFVDTANSRFAIMSRASSEDRNTSEVKGIDLTSAIQLTRDASIKVLMDPRSEDSLVLKGVSDLLFSMDKSGQMNLTGNYKIEEGAYQLSFSELVKRKFTIQQGSNITWNGQPTDAFVDITAIYTLKTSPMDLVQEQLAGSAEEQKNMYKQQLPFDVHLNIKGEMMKPEITFDIQLPEEHRGALDGSVFAKLAQLRENPSELDKQVFALLVLNRFIAENPFEASDGGGVAGAARNSASQALTQQLNALSNRYVKGVDLDLGVESSNDYSTGEEQGRTQLQLGVSKNLFNDKVVVKVGGNLDLEGERARQNNLSDVAGNILVEYKLTEDGRYRLKGFRQHTFEDIIEGELIETGAGVLFIRDYNKLNELFNKKKEEENDKKRERNRD